MTAVSRRHLLINLSPGIYYNEKIGD